MGLLDDAIAANETRTPSRKCDRILSRLTDIQFDQLDRLLDMLTAPVTEYGHRALAGIIRYICDELSVEHEDVSEKDVHLWRSKQ